MDSPIAERVFALLTPATLTHAFDEMTGFAKGMGEAIGSLVDKLRGGQAAAQIQAIGNALGGMIGKLFGSTDFGTFFTELPSGVKYFNQQGQAWVEMMSGKWASSITTALTGIRSTVEFIQQHFNTIKTGLEVVVGLLTAAKISEMGQSIWKNVISPLFNIGRAVINVGVQEGGLGAAATTGGARAAGAAGLLTSVPAMWLLGGGVLATELHRRFGILGKTSAEPATVAGLPGAGISGGAARADVNELFKSSRQIAEEHQKAAEAVSKTAAAANSAAPALQSTSSAANSAASSLNGLAGQISGAFDKIIGAANAAVAGAAKPPTPLLPIPHHAHGGIVTRPHVGLLGERGPEAIIPLAKAGAHMLGGLLGGGLAVHSNPVINVTGGTDLGGLSEILAEHAQSIAAEVQRILAIELERHAVV